MGDCGMAPRRHSLVHIGECDQSSDKFSQNLQASLIGLQSQISVDDAHHIDARPRSIANGSTYFVAVGSALKVGTFGRRRNRADRDRHVSRRESHKGALNLPRRLDGLYRPRRDEGVAQNFLNQAEQKLRRPDQLMPMQHQPLRLRIRVDFSEQALLMSAGPTSHRRARSVDAYNPVP
uniref:Uncharacterized protein n=1 Tax=Mycena chlorophos TaxID=658473 RepID=A0ABQ0LUH3_MYCCL|nr:predicted protein [Mycena chlorophos]